MSPRRQHPKTQQATVTLYHATSSSAASAIIEEGFRETVDTLTQRVGIWFSDRWVEYGTHQEAAVTIEMPEDVLAPYDLGVAAVDRLDGSRWIRVPEEAFRCYLIPASIANQYRRQILTDARPRSVAQKRSVGPALTVPK